MIIGGAQVRDHGRKDPSQIGAREDGDDSLHGASGIHVDPADAPVGDGRAQDSQMKRSGDPDIVNVASPARQKSRVLAARYDRAHELRHGVQYHHVLLSASRCASMMASAMSLSATVLRKPLEP